MAFITAIKKYSYSTYTTSWASQQIVFSNVKVEFIWNIKHKDGLIVVEYNGILIEPKDYKPGSYVNCAKKFLKIVKELEKISSSEKLNEFLQNL